MMMHRKKISFSVIRLPALTNRNETSFSIKNRNIINLFFFLKEKQ
jgi:hypothetical protein